VSKAKPNKHLKHPAVVGIPNRVWKRRKPNVTSAAGEGLPLIPSVRKPTDHPLNAHHFSALRRQR